MPLFRAACVVCKRPDKVTRSDRRDGAERGVPVHCFLRGCVQLNVMRVFWVDLPNRTVFRPGLGLLFRRKIPAGIKKCLEWGFGYEESEYEVRFGLAP